MTKESKHIHISAKHNWFDLKLQEVWQYRDLILLFTKKTFVVTYKQTILGPLWLLIHPLLSSFIYWMIFGKIAGMGTDGVPQILFYLGGTAIWGFFASCLNGNASTFVNNAGLFGKVYFPRLTMPISNVLSSFLKLMIQMSMIFLLVAYYTSKDIIHPHFSMWPVLLLLIVQLGFLGMSTGILISSLTTKYRDLSVLVSFGVQLWMYATPVVYPLSQVQDGLLRSIVLWNPVTMSMEVFRYAMFGVGNIDTFFVMTSWVMTGILTVISIVIFNRVERTFMDTV